MSSVLRCLNLISLVACATTEQIQQPVVRTSKGLLRGVNAGATNIYYSLPYASPPTGKLRYQPPQEAEAWNGTYYYACQDLTFGPPRDEARGTARA